MTARQPMLFDVGESMLVNYACHLKLSAYSNVIPIKTTGTFFTKWEKNLISVWNPKKAKK